MHKQCERVTESVATAANGKQVGELSLMPDERWPYFAQDEVEAAAAVLRSGQVNQWTGPDVSSFEHACIERFGGGRAIALANGSLALELALRSFGIGPGDEVVVTPRSFIASASCVVLVGATPVFADIDPDSGNITPESVERVLTDQTRAIIAVHLAGWPADIPSLMDLVRGRPIRVIEDCAQAHGAEIGGKSVGGMGDAAAWSFCQDKIISTGGEGGLLTLKDQAAWQWARSFKDHGKNFAKATAPGEVPGQFRYIHDSIGTNWRMTGPQAAIGTVQLGKLDEWRDRRARNARIWAQALNKIADLRIPLPDADRTQHAFYKLYFRIEGGSDERASALRAEMLRRAWDSGLRLFSGGCPEIYREDAFAGFDPARCPAAHSLGARSLLLEVHPTLRPDLLQRRAEALTEIARQVLGSA